MISMLVVDSPVGAVRLYGSDTALVGAYLPAQDGPPALASFERRETSVLALAARQLTEYFAGARQIFDLPLAPAGTPFQRTVWHALSTIPFAATWSYRDVAHAIGSPRAVRAVGAANGRNPLAIIVPCHRVIGARGALTGYAGGLAAKEWLLAHEGRGATVGTAHVSC